MPTGLHRRVLLTVTRLESRDTPAANWPIPRLAYSGYDLSQTYGQMERVYGRSELRMHSGIDIVATAGTPVTAIDDGKVYNEPINVNEAGFLSRMTITNQYLQNPTPSGWTYLHLVMNNNSLTSPLRDYRQNDPIGPGNRAFASVAKFPYNNNPSHLHLEWTSGADTNFGSYWLRPTKDPLDLLESGGDTVAPTVAQIHFKSGEMNAGGNSWGPGAPQSFETTSRTHQYFTSQDYAGKLVVGRMATTDSMDQANLPGTDVIDIVGETYDKFKVDGRKLGIKLININITGKTIIGIQHAAAPFVFKDEFTADPNQSGAQTHNSMYNPETVRTAYTVSAKFHDVYDKLAQSDPLRLNYERNFFYTMTNFDENQIIEPSDKSRAWATTTLRTGLNPTWNDPSKPRATNNATSLDPDGYYDIQVNAADQAGNVGTLTRRVLLDNWQQTLIVMRVPNTTNTFSVTGSNWPANAKVPLRLVKTFDENGCFMDGVSVDRFQVGRYADLETDADGNIPPTIITAGVHPELGNIATQFHADYQNDGIEQSQLDATYEVTDPPPQRPVRLTALAYQTLAYDRPGGRQESSNFAETPLVSIHRPTPTLEVSVGADREVQQSVIPALQENHANTPSVCTDPMALDPLAAI